MTPTAFAARMDEILHYLGGLLVSPDRSTSFEIGRTFALLDDEDRLRYVTSLLEDNRPGTREYEIAWDLRAIIVGYTAEELAS